MWHIWLIAAIIFLIIEIFTVGFLIFWLSIGALLAMIVSFFTKNLIIQTTVFVISSTILVFATRHLVNKISGKKIPTNVYSFKGKKAIVTQDIDSTKGIGQIKSAGEIWSAKSQNDSFIAKGTEVTIVKIDGVKAVVKPDELVLSFNK